MRAMLSGLLAAVLLLSLAACGQQETEPDTLGQSLLQAFQTAYEADPQADLDTLAQGLLTQETVGFQGTTAPVEPGTLMGFGNTPIEGFSQGVMFAPVIGTIPFLGYLFRLEEGTDGAAFVDTLQSGGGTSAPRPTRWWSTRRETWSSSSCAPTPWRRPPRTRPPDPKPQSGGKLGWGLLCPFAPGQGRNPTGSPHLCGFSRRAFCREPLRTGGK